MGDVAADEGLVAEALRARETAYAPYSRFLVGAAVRAADGRVFTGANVENASYGLTVCAERIAVFKAVTAGARAIVACAVAADAPRPVPPCGACRQVLREFGEGMAVHMADLKGGRVQASLAELLPLSFGLGDLGVRP